MTEDENARHSRKMAKKAAARERIMAAKTEERGLTIVHTGKGKGKTTAAMGMVVRCIGHGFPVRVAQFVKGRRDTAERAVLDRFPDLVETVALGEGFTWETQDREKDTEMARAVWDRARQWLADPEVRMVLLDEINIVLKYGYLEADEVLDALAARPADQHAVLTGRNALDPVLEAADLVTEMAQVKHPFRAGVKAQPGVEF